MNYLLIVSCAERTHASLAVRFSPNTCVTIVTSRTSFTPVSFRIVTTVLRLQSCMCTKYVLTSRRPKPLGQWAYNTDILCHVYCSGLRNNLAPKSLQEAANDHKLVYKVWRKTRNINQASGSKVTKQDMTCWCTAVCYVVVTTDCHIQSSQPSTSTSSLLHCLSSGLTSS